MKLAFALLFALPLFAADTTTITLSPKSFEGLPRVKAKLKPHHSDGPEAEYEGVTLSALLVKAGVPSGEAIRGKSLSFVVIAKAADGYQAVYALPELDPAFSKKIFILADKKNGKPIPAEEGPYRIVVPAEARQARSVRQVTSLVIRPVE